MKLHLLGDHQAANAAVAVAAVEILCEQGLALDDTAVAEGLALVNWPARMEVMQRRPFIILDCAHNVASAEALVETLLASFPLPAGAAAPPRRLLIFAGNRDKDLANMLQVLSPHFDHIFLTQFANNPRRVSPAQLANLLPARLPGSFSVVDNSLQALKKAQAMADPDDLICITGSVFLAGELRPSLL